jgi:hypothetical protein
MKEWTKADRAANIYPVAAMKAQCENRAIIFTAVDPEVGYVEFYYEGMPQQVYSGTGADVFSWFHGVDEADEDMLKVQEFLDKNTGKSIYA